MTTGAADRLVPNCGSTLERPLSPPERLRRRAVRIGHESARALPWEYANFPERISATLKPRLDEGWRVTRAKYDGLRETARLCRRALAERMREVNFLLAAKVLGV